MLTADLISRDLLLDIPWQSLASGLLIWLALELAFYVAVFHYIHPHINKLRKPPANPLNPRECLKRILGVLDTIRDTYGIDKFCAGWFKGAPLEQVRRGNMKSFFAWAAFHAHLEDLKESDHVMLEEIVDEVERRHDVRLQPGHNPEVEHVAFTREELSFTHRLLMFYVMIKAAQIIGALVAVAMGFLRHEAGGLVYWYRPSRERGPSRQLPMVFFHGICPGIFCYLPFLTRFLAGREAIIFELPHVVTQLHLEAAEREHVVAALAEATRRHGIKDYVVAGHSFGSIVAGWAYAAFPERVKQMVFIDPVCFLLCLPDVCYNFLYRCPSANPMERSLKDLLDPASELTVSHALRRHFWWYHNVVWLEDLKIPVTVALSMIDDIVPSEAILSHFKWFYGEPDEHGRFKNPQSFKQQSRGAPSGAGAKDQQQQQQPSLPDARVLAWKGLGHGGMLISEDAQDKLLSAMTSQAREQGLFRTRRAMQGDQVDPRWRAVELKADVQPPMRYKVTAVSMPELKKVFLFGGLGAKPSNDLWMLDAESREWTLVKVQGSRPPPRLYHTMTYDEDSTFYIFAGQEDSMRQEMIPKTEQEGRELRYRAYQRRPLLADTWEYDAKEGQWHYRQCPGKQPAARRGHTTIFLKDRAGSAEQEPPVYPTRRASSIARGEPPAPVKKASPARELLVIGGATENRRGHEVAANDLWSLNLDNMQWNHLQASGSFQGRFDHTATRIGRRIFIVGGVTTTSADFIDMELQRHWGQVQSQIMALEIDTLTWIRIETNPFGDISSLALHGHSAVQDPREGSEQSILLFGGRATDSWTSDVMKYDTIHNTWTILPITSSLAPPPRHGHVCVVYKQDKKPTVTPALSLRGTLKKTNKRTERNLLGGLTLSLPPPAPLLRMPCLLLFGGSLLDGSPGYKSGQLFSFEWTVAGPDSPQLTSPNSASNNNNNNNSVVQAMPSDGGASLMPSLMEGGGGGGCRPHTAPTFTRTLGSTRNSQRISVREPVPWEYQEVKAMIRRHQAAVFGARRAAQATKPMGDQHLGRKPVTAPGKLESHHQGLRGSLAETTLQQGGGPEEEEAAATHHPLGKLDMPSTQDIIMHTGKRLGLVKDPKKDRHHHHHHHHQRPHTTSGGDRLTIFEKKKIYFNKLRREERRALRQEQQQHQHHQASSNFLLEQGASASFVTLPSAMPASHSIASTLRPATTGMRYRSQQQSQHHHHPQHHEASMLSILDPESWGSTSSLDWHVISRHTPTVSLGR